MKGIPINSQRLKSLAPGMLGRTALLLGVAGVTAGVSLLGAASASASLGTQPGTVTLNPASGSTGSTPTWSTSVACPAGFQGSGIFREVWSDGATTNSISAVSNSVAAPFSGTLQANMATIQASGNIDNGGTQELVVVCFSGASGTGNSEGVMDTWVTYSADGSSYTETSTPPSSPTSTTTTLTASPSPATVGQTVTLTATVAAGSTSPAGSVQFEVGGTAIGSAVAVSSTGVATTTTTFGAAGSEALSAVFTPASTSSYQSSTGTCSETVNAASANSGSEPISVTVPQAGAFTLTVAAGTVSLNAAGTSATGALEPITVSDTRNYAPGWSVSGQAADFTGSGSAAGVTIPGNQLGWTPTDTALSDAQLGGTVTPATPGLGSAAATLASAAAGHGLGTSVLGANLNLAIPATALAGPYASALTVTAVTSAP